MLLFIILFYSHAYKIPIISYYSHRDSHFYSSLFTIHINNIHTYIIILANAFVLTPLFLLPLKSNLDKEKKRESCI